MTHPGGPSQLFAESQVGKDVPRVVDLALSKELGQAHLIVSQNCTTLTHAQTHHTQHLVTHTRTCTTSTTCHCTALLQPAPLCRSARATPLHLPLHPAAPAHRAAPAWTAHIPLPHPAAPTLSFSPAPVCGNGGGLPSMEIKVVPKKKVQSLPPSLCLLAILVSNI
jgi:hypothetical protein